MLGEHYSPVTITNHLFSSQYCFCEEEDNQVVFVANIEVEECWDPMLTLQPQ